MNIKIFRFRMKTLKQIGVGIESNKEYKFYAFIFWLFVICCSTILITWVYVAIYGDFYNINKFFRNNYVYSFLIFFMVSVFLIFDDNLLNHVTSQINHNALKHFFALVIFLMNIALVPTSQLPFIHPDEVGYWAHAATLAGFDWSGITSIQLPWYSYGYSFILCPLFKISSNPQLAHKLALTINSLFIIISYYIIINILIKVFNENSNILVYFLSSAAVLYTSYQVQSGITWTETVLVLNFSLILYCFICFISNKKILYYLYTILLLGILFMIHNRTCGVLFAFFLISCLLVLDKIITKKYIFIFIILTSLILLFDYNIKDYLIYKQNIQHANAIKISFIKNVIAITSSFDHFQRFICLFISHLFSFTISSNIIGFLFVIFNLIIFTKLIFNRYNQYNLIYPISNHVKFYTYMFITMSFIIMMSMQSIWFINYMRYDHILYTRYYDFITGYLIIFGIMEYGKLQKNTSLLLLTTTFFFLIVSPQLLFYLTNTSSHKFFQSFCAPAIFFYYKEFKLNFINYSYILILILFTLLFLNLLLKNKLLYRKNITIILLCLLNIIYCTYISIPARRDVWKLYQLFGFNSLTLYNKFNTSYNSYNFYAYNDVPLVGLYAIQFRLFKKKLIIIDKKSNIIPKGYIICNKESIDELFFLKKEFSFMHSFLLLNKYDCVKDECLNVYFSNITNITPPFYSAIFKSGWHLFENTHIWSSGKATLILPKPGPEKTDFLMSFFIHAASPDNPMTVIFRGGKEATAWERKMELHDADVHEIRLPIDSDTPEPYVIIHLEVPGATSPKAKGLSEDTRELGIALKHIDAIPNLSAPLLDHH